MFEAPEVEKRIVIDKDYVTKKLGSIVEDENAAAYVL